jgi:hypothetical protein
MTNEKAHYRYLSRCTIKEISQLSPRQGATFPTPQSRAGIASVLERVSQRSDLSEALTSFLTDPHEPYLLDVMVERESNVLPMIPSGKGYRDTIFRDSDADADET